MELGCTGTREKVERNHEAYMNLAFIDMRTSCPQRFGWILLVLAVASASAQPTITTSSADPQIAAALKQISAEKIRANIEKLASFQRRSTLSAQDQASIAAGHGIGAARKWIKSEFERYSRDCGVRLECARVLSRLKFPATIIFLTVSREEQGLNGSHHFAQMAKSEGWNIAAVLNNDIVGGDRNSQQDPSVARVFSEGVPSAVTDTELKLIRNLGGESDSPSRQIARYVGEVGRTYVVGLKPTLVFRLDRYLRGGDHISFNQQGFAAVRFTEYREDYHHQHQNVRTENGIEYGDLPKFVNFDYVANVARLNAATLASLASGPAPPAKVRLVTKELENDSTLTWEPPPGGRASTYEVLWRATTSAEWEHTQAVGNVTRTTLPISKDNAIFAIRAVDKEGHRSLPVVPMPER